MEKVIAIVGMAGSGKSTAAEILLKHLGEKGFKIRFGDITEKLVRREGLELTQENERKVREKIRKELGMDAYAKLNEGKIKEALDKGKVVIIDGLYSWEEYLYLRERFKLVVLNIHASPKVRYKRLAKRKERGLSPEEAWERDKAEIEGLHKAGPIAMADHVIINEDDLDTLEKNLLKFLEKEGLL